MSDQTPTRQGQIWEVHTVSGRIVEVVIVDDDVFISRAAMISCVQIRDRHEIPDQISLLAVPLHRGGVASISDLQILHRRRFAIPLGEVEPTELDLIKIALSVRLGIGG